MSERQKLFLVAVSGDFGQYDWGREPEEAIEKIYDSLDSYCSPSNEVAAEIPTEVAGAVCVEIPELEEDATREKVEDLDSVELASVVNQLIANRPDLPTTKVEITFARTGRSYLRLS
jgi:hypothetical protein